MANPYTTTGKSSLLAVRNSLWSVGGHRVPTCFTGFPAHDLESVLGRRDYFYLGSILGIRMTETPILKFPGEALGYRSLRTGSGVPLVTRRRDLPLTGEHPKPSGRECARAQMLPAM